MVQLVTTPPRIYLAGVTQPVPNEIEDYLQSIDAEWDTDSFEIEHPEVGLDPLVVSEAAGRVCYSSWENKKGSTRAAYHRDSIIARSHGSVLEHIWFNFLVADVPRSAQLEIVRHGEGTAFSWESTRFTDARPRFVVPQRFRGDQAAVDHFGAECAEQFRAYREFLDYGRREGETGTIGRKRAKEAARDILGGAYASDGMVSMNLRAARHIVQIRSASDAALSIREWAVGIFTKINAVVPAAFADAVISDDLDGPVISFRHPKV